MIRFQSAAKFNQTAVLIFFEKAQIQKKDFSAISGSILCDAIKGVIDAGQFHGNDKEIFPIIVNKKTVVLAGVGAYKKQFDRAALCCASSCFVGLFKRKPMMLKLFRIALMKKLLLQLSKGFSSGLTVGINIRTHQKNSHVRLIRIMFWRSLKNVNIHRPL